MRDRPGATDSSDDQQEAAAAGYFAPLASARSMRLTTFERDGLPQSASVPGIVNGDRAYFRARNRSGTAKRLRHTSAVQVTRSGGLGFFTFGPPLDSVARPLAGAEASAAAAKLDRRHPAWRRFPIRPRRRQGECYELLAAEAADRQVTASGEHSSSLIVRVQTSRRLMNAGGATATSLATVCPPPATSRVRPSDYTRVTTVSMTVSAARPGEA